MVTTSSPNIAVCPKCNTEFEYNRVNGLALIEVNQMILAKTKMHCRLTLNALELHYPDKKIPPDIKKGILDGYNDLARSIRTSLGFDIEVE